MKQDEYNTKMKRMEKHVQDITAKEISNREAVLLLKDHMRNIDDMSILEKEKSNRKNSTIFTPLELAKMLEQHNKITFIGCTCCGNDYTKELAMETFIIFRAFLE